MVAACTAASCAQSFSHIRLIAIPASPPVPIPMLAWIVPENFQSAAVSIFPVPATTRENREFSSPPRGDTDFVQALENKVEFSGTPFTQQVRVPLGSLFGGRVSLGGFNAVTPMEHIQRGLPGGGSMDAWAPAPMGHAGMILPKDDNQYGFCLTFHRSRNVEDGRFTKWNGLAGWLASISLW